MRATSGIRLSRQRTNLPTPIRRTRIWCRADVVAEDLFAQDQFDLAIAVGQAVVGKQPPVSRLARTAWTVSHSRFDLGFAEAERRTISCHLYAADDRKRAGDQGSHRVVDLRAGRMARNAGDLETAVTHLPRLGQAVPDSDIRARPSTTLRCLINLQAWAARELERSGQLS